MRINSIVEAIIADWAAKGPVVLLWQRPFKGSSQPHLSPFTARRYPSQQRLLWILGLVTEAFWGPDVSAP